MSRRVKTIIYNLWRERRVRHEGRVKGCYLHILIHHFLFFFIFFTQVWRRRLKGKQGLDPELQAWKSEVGVSEDWWLKSSTEEDRILKMWWWCWRWPQFSKTRYHVRVTVDFMVVMWRNTHSTNHTLDPEHLLSKQGANAAPRISASTASPLWCKGGSFGL